MEHTFAFYSMLSRRESWFQKVCFKIVEEALKYNQVESVLEGEEEEDIFHLNTLKYYQMLKCQQQSLNF